MWPCRVGVWVGLLISSCLPVSKNHVRDEIGLRLRLIHSTERITNRMRLCSVHTVAWSLEDQKQFERSFWLFQDQTLYQGKGRLLLGQPKKRQAYWCWHHYSLSSNPHILSTSRLNKQVYMPSATFQFCFSLRAMSSMHSLSTERSTKNISWLLRGDYLAPILIALHPSC